MRLGLIFLWLILAAGCSADKVTYRVGSSQPGLTRDQAEQTLAQPDQASTAVQLDRPLKAIATPLPEYPRSFRSASIVGSVRVQFTVEPDGSVSNPSVMGSPPPPLVAITLASILRWRFEPPRRGGNPTQVRVQQDIVFNVE